MDIRYIPFCLAGLFILIWIIWAAARNRLWKEGRTHTAEGRGILITLELLAVCTAVAFGVTTWQLMR